MYKKTNKNNLIKWMVLIGDLLLYFALVHLVVYLFPEKVPHTVIRHTSIVSLIGILCIALFSIAIPTVIHRRKVDVKEVIIRNIIVVILSQTTFAILWHMITVPSGNEKIFNLTLGLSALAGFVSIRFLERALLGFMRSQGRNTRAVIFVGNDPANLSVYQEIMNDPTTGYVVRGYYSNSEFENAPKGLEKLGSIDDLMQIVNSKTEDAGHLGALSADDIFCSLSHNEEEIITKLMTYCDHEVIRFYYVPRVLHNVRMALKPEMMGSSIVFTKYHEPLSNMSNRVIKRLFDIALSSFVCLFLLPMIPVIWLIIHWQSPGPLFFCQERTGMNGRNFKVIKFRSMHVNDQANKVQATKNDPRKFAFGDFMRKTNIDELPQFFNVLKGDMSVVGPRPHMTFHTEQYSALIDKYMVRHFAKPGITGWAQVTGFRGETEELWQMEGRIQKDIWYIENWSLWLDVKICFMTALTFIAHDENAY